MIELKNHKEKLKDLVTQNPEILNGIPVFKDTRVPIKNLFDYIESGKTISEFLEDFPSVDKIKVVKILNFAEELFSAETEL